jgi:hypothetical protein
MASPPGPNRPPPASLAGGMLRPAIVDKVTSVLAESGVYQPVLGELPQRCPGGPAKLLIP